MKINNDKTKTVIFNTSNKKDFTPRLTNLEGKTYKNVENFTLLGVDFLSDTRKGKHFFIKIVGLN